MVARGIPQQTAPSGGDIVVAPAPESASQLRQERHRYPRRHDAAPLGLGACLGGRFSTKMPRLTALAVGDAPSRLLAGWPATGPWAAIPAPPVATWLLRLAISAANNPVRGGIVVGQPPK